MEPFELVAIMRMGNQNGYYYLKPISMCTQVSALWVVRPEAPFTKGEIQKAKFVKIPGKRTLQKLWHVYKEAKRLAKRSEVQALCSFNPVPYGLIALLAARSAGKPAHLGFVGTDWYRHCKSWYGAFLNAYLRKADMFTVTGPKMRKEMIGRGYQETKIKYLPHAIDLEIYEDIPPTSRKYDCVFVGAIIRRKRVDLILSAVAEALKAAPSTV